MLNVLKKIIPSESWMPAKRVVAGDGQGLSGLRKGSDIRFGYMPQADTSGKELNVSSTQKYDFGHSRFISHILKNELDEVVCYIIIAKNNGNGRYLAISRHLTSDELFTICSEDDVALFKKPEKLNLLFVREHSRGLNGWLTMRYNAQISGVRGTKTVDGVDKIFDYSLLVSEDNEKAIEIELYPDGQCDVYVTVYRPISDIVNIVNPVVKPKPIKKPVIKKVETPKKEPKVSLKDDEKLANKLLDEPQLTKENNLEIREVTSKIEDVLDKKVNVSDESLSVAKDEVELHVFKKTKPIENEVFDGQTLSCDMKIAAKILDEAVRNDMRLSDVVKRVLGLEIATSERISFELPLSDEDYAKLAARYSLHPNNKKAIVERIIDDLADFTGEPRYIKALSNVS